MIFLLRDCLWIFTGFRRFCYNFEVVGCFDMLMILLFLFLILFSYYIIFFLFFIIPFPLPSFCIQFEQALAKSCCVGLGTCYSLCFQSKYAMPLCLANNGPGLIFGHGYGLLELSPSITWYHPLNMEKGVIREKCVSFSSLRDGLLVWELIWLFSVSKANGDLGLLLHVVLHP